MTETCPHASAPELGAYVDGELSGAAARWWDEHLRTCAQCRNEVTRVRALGTSLRASLPVSEPSSALREAVREIARAPTSIGAEAAAAPRGGPTWRAALAAVVLLGAGFGLGRVGFRPESSGVAGELVAAHVRSLQVDHLVDVASTTHHVVKPWFAGKLDFSPPVPELPGDTVPLLGARTEYLDGRAVAALVYGHGPHRINLFVWPAKDGACREEPPIVRDGFNLVRGRTAAMEFWAVSDLNQGELRAFAAAWLAAATKSEGGCRPG